VFDVRVLVIILWYAGVNATPLFRQSRIKTKHIRSRHSSAVALNLPFRQSAAFCSAPHLNVNQSTFGAHMSLDRDDAVAGSTRCGATARAGSKVTSVREWDQPNSCVRRTNMCDATRDCRCFQGCRRWMGKRTYIDLACITGR